MDPVDIHTPKMEKTSSLVSNDFTNCDTEAMLASFGRFFAKETLKMDEMHQFWFLWRNKKQNCIICLPPWVWQGHHPQILGFCHHRTRFFNTQVVKFPKELTDSWEILLPKDTSILPFSENSSKCVITDNIPKDANALKPWVLEWNMKLDWDDKEHLSQQLMLRAILLFVSALSYHVRNVSVFVSEQFILVRNKIYFGDQNAFWSARSFDLVYPTLLMQDRISDLCLTNS